ncbi:MAG: sensor histidine kinase [Omnitrophica WOR_2 bacterium]
MSLRVRLTLLYTSLVGGIFLLFGVVVYSTVIVALMSQVDKTLDETSTGIITFLNENKAVSLGELTNIPIPSSDIPSDVSVQLWSRGPQTLQAVVNTTYQKPLDSTGMLSRYPIYRDVTIGVYDYRVLTVPLVLGTRPIGTMQVGTKINDLETIQKTLLSVLIVAALFAICIAGLAAWFSTNRALSPLQDVTQTALQITHADDLSRRIPYQGPPDDEVGQLITAFNQTLGRLESLFNTQRRFMADVGHELRTPLTVIKGNVGLMQRMGEADEESLSGIVNEVDRLTRLVGDLLLLAQAESGKLPLDQRLVELDTLTLEAMQQMRVLAKERLQLKLGDIDQVLICGDRDRIKQVLVNLIGNAINYTPHGGEVIVGLGKEGNQARLTVTDNGPGIASEDLPHIFERFYRGEKSRTRSRDGKGFGLGLSIAYWIVRNHGGRIDVDSTLGRGTTFCVWLPLANGNCDSKPAL